MADEELLEGEETPRILKPDTYVSIGYPIEPLIQEKKLTFEEASKCLSLLGKDESGARYAYLMITATDRKLTDISTILNFRHVLFLDLGGNYLTLDALQVLVNMPFLVLLKAENNRVESAALGYMPYLQVLDLNRNQITETCDISQPMLDSLELNHNLIYTAQFDVDRLRDLNILELRGNHLIDISGSYPLNLEKLYLADNKISKINTDDLSKLTKLNILHLRDNSIGKLNGFSEQLVNLNYLNLRNNKINKIRQFRKLKCLPKLETLIIKGNPVAGVEPELKGEDKAEQENEDEDEDEEKTDNIKVNPIRIALLVLLPTLKRINKELVSLAEQEAAFDVKEEKYKEIMDESSSEDETEAPTTTDFTTDFTTDTEKTVNYSERAEEEENEEYN